MEHMIDFAILCLSPSIHVHQLVRMVSAKGMLIFNFTFNTEICDFGGNKSKWGNCRPPPNFNQNNFVRIRMYHFFEDILQKVEFTIIRLFLNGKLDFFDK